MNDWYRIRMFQRDDDEMLASWWMNLRCCSLETKSNDMISTKKSKRIINKYFYCFVFSFLRILISMLVYLHAQAASIYVVRMILTSAMLWSLANERLYRVLNEPSRSLSLVFFSISICRLALNSSLEFSVNVRVTFVLTCKSSSYNFDKRIVWDYRNKNWIEKVEIKFKSTDFFAMASSSSAIESIWSVILSVSLYCGSR